MKTKFRRGDTVRHIVSGNTYTILVVPDPTDLLEECNLPFYKYTAGSGYRKWNRRQDEMEDGRFVLVTKVEK